MNWSTTFRVREFVRGSLWVLPLAGGLLGVLLGSGLIGADETLHLPAYWTYTSSTASTVLSAIVGAMAALTGFVVTARFWSCRWPRAPSRPVTCACGTAIDC
jgi:hypothetical protein